MTRLSDHLKIYSTQKESIFSILGRITINVFILVFPLVTLNFFSVFFLVKWALIITILYHFSHFFSKTLDSTNGILGLLWLFGLLFFESIFLWFIAWFLLFIHVFLGTRGLFKDYLVAERTELFFKNGSIFLTFLVSLVTIVLVGFVILL